MITKDNMVYILKRTELKNITEHQLEEFISEFDLDDKGNVLIPYQHKGYTCNDKMDLFINSDIQAISFFSGCGGLDIGTQLAGVKVLSSLSEKELQNEKVIIDILRKCFEDKEDIASMAEGDNLEMLVEKVMELVRNLYL